MIRKFFTQALIDNYLTVTKLTKQTKVYNPYRILCARFTMATLTLPRRKFILDCDAGTDDAQALMMALAQPDIDVLAVTTVFGNTTLQNTSHNCLRVLKFKNRLDIPVYRGSNKSLLGVPSPDSGYHGDDGLGDIHIDGVDPVDKALIQSEHAALALTRLANQQPGEITLVATGPLTNIALALHMDPTFGTKLKDVYIMGGNVEGKGNVTMSAEFNFFCDPEAAYFVFNNLGRKLTLASLEICENHAFSWEWYEKFTNGETKTSKLVGDFEHIMITREKKRGIAESYVMLWDQVAMAAAINNQVALETRDVYATVELHGSSTRGQVVVDWRKKAGKDPNVRLIMKLDQTLFGKLLYSGIQD